MREEVEDKLSKQLQELKEGESFEVKEEDGGTTTYINPKKGIVCENHYYAPDGHQSDEFDYVKCRYCGNGKIINVATQKLTNGKITKI